MLLDHSRRSKHVLYAVLQTYALWPRSRIKMCSSCDFSYGSPNTCFLTMVEGQNMFSMWFSKCMLLSHDRRSKRILHAGLYIVLQTRAPRPWSRIRMCSPYDFRFKMYSPCDFLNTRSLATVEDWNVFSMWFFIQFSKYALLDHGWGSKYVLHAALQIHASRLWLRIETCSLCGSPNTHSTIMVEDWNMFSMRFSKHVLLSHGQGSKCVLHAIFWRAHSTMIEEQYASPCDSLTHTFFSHDRGAICISMWLSGSCALRS